MRRTSIKLENIPTFNTHYELVGMKQHSRMSTFEHEKTNSIQAPIKKSSKIWKINTTKMLTKPFKNTTYKKNTREMLLEAAAS